MNENEKIIEELQKKNEELEKRLKIEKIDKYDKMISSESNNVKFRLYTAVLQLILVCVNVAGYIENEKTEHLLLAALWAFSSALTCGMAVTSFLDKKKLQNQKEKFLLEEINGLEEEKVKSK